MSVAPASLNAVNARVAEGDDAARQAVAHRCVYCALPVPKHRLGGDGRDYCCFGCRMTHGIARAGEGEEEGAQHVSPLLLRVGLGVFLAMNIMAFNWFFYAEHVYGEHTGSGSAVVASLFAYLQMLLCTLVVVLLGAPLLVDVLPSAGRDVSSRTLRQSLSSMHTLILVGVVAAYGLSVVNTVRGEGSLYFDTAAMILVLVTLGAFLDSRGKRAAGEAITQRFADLPEMASLWRDGQWVASPRDAVSVGDRLRVRAGEAMPIDGVILDGHAGVDTSSLTGESLPRHLGVGDEVIAGTVNLDGVLEIEATRVGRDVLASQIDALLQRVMAERPPIQRLADRVAAVFLPAVACVALATLGGWWWHAGFSEGLLAALSVLLISCPCALGLAAPLASFRAITRAARHGIVFRSAAALEHAAAVRQVVFDKTGTLTEPMLALRDIAWQIEDSNGREHAMSIAAALAQASTHPLSRSIASLVDLDTSREVEGPTLQDTHVLPGLGVEAAIDGKTWRLGSRRFAEQSGLGVAPSPSQGEGWGEGCAVMPAGTQREASPTGSAKFPLANDAAASSFHPSPHLSPEGRGIGGERLSNNSIDVDRPIVLLFNEQAIVACFHFDEQLRPDAKRAVESLRELGIAPHMLTGDRVAAAARVASSLGMTYDAELLPQDKLDHVEAMRRQGVTAFVGDGVNDAPALAAADVGFSLRHGSGLAKQAGDVHLLADQLRAAPLTLAIARDTVRRIRLNLAWAFGYNTIGIALAASGVLNPVFAASAMVVSSTLIITTSRHAGRAATEAIESANAGDASTVQPPMLPEPSSTKQPAGGVRHA